MIFHAAMAPMAGYLALFTTMGMCEALLPIIFTLKEACAFKHIYNTSPGRQSYRCFCFIYASVIAIFTMEKYAAFMIFDFISPRDF